MILRSAGLACSTMASTRIMREKAKVHQKIGSTRAIGGTSHNGMVNSCLLYTSNSP